MPRSTWTWGWAVALLALGLALVVLFALPTGQYLILPGSTLNLNRIVHVHGERPPAHGRILMVAVSVAPADYLQVLTARFQAGEELVPAGELMPAGMSFEQYIRLSMLQMNQSHSAAQVAAFHALDLPVRTLRPEVYVAGVVAPGPSNGRLQVMDLIRTVNGVPVRTAAQLVTQVHAMRPGTTVRLQVVRNGKTRTVAVRTGRSPTTPGSAFLGIELMQVLPYKFPRQVTIDTNDIGGPSAGMMMSLAIIAQIDPHARFPGRAVVAGTGEITASGQVQPIGGVAEKVITAYRSGARLFLCPQANYAAAVAVQRALHIPIRIVAVKSLAQALNAVGYTRSPRTLAG